LISEKNDDDAEVDSILPLNKSQRRAQFLLLFSQNSGFSIHSFISSELLALESAFDCKSKVKLTHILSFSIFVYAVFPSITSYGRLKTATVRNAEIDRINCTKNQVKGTIITHTTNLGRADFNSQVPPHCHTIFIKAIIINIKANIKYTILEISIQISFK